MKSLSKNLACLLVGLLMVKSTLTQEIEHNGLPLEISGSEQEFLDFNKETITPGFNLVTEEIHTEAPNNELVTENILTEVSPNGSEADQETTAASQDLETAEDSSSVTITPPAEESEVHEETEAETAEVTTIADVAQEEEAQEENVATNQPSLSESTAAPVSTDPAAPSTAAPVITESSTAAAVVTDAPSTSAPAPLPVACSIIGNSPHEHDCHQYYSCQSDAQGMLVQSTHSCPPRTAFSTELRTCTRDLISCNDDGIVCSPTATTFPDGESNTAYYWCVKSLLGGWHKYHVQCRKGDIFNNMLQKCFMDMDNMQNLPLDYGLGPDDEDFIKMELKHFKLYEKQILKEQKLKAKMEQKLQKELAKKAEKEAKEQAKLLDESFVCAAEGNYASPISNTQYYACINKKGMLKPTKMQCQMGYVFDQTQSACILANTVPVVDADDMEDDD